jgi:eukaryotic-like serine/threonine-protein kinase
MSQVEPESPEEDTLGWLVKAGANTSGELAGKTIGDFLVERLLGRGGMGEVYLARQISLNRPVALKVLRTDLVSRQSYISRFETEAAAVAKLNHPSIVHVYAYGKLDPIRFIAMEYVEGTNLREYIRKKGALDLPLSYSIMRQSAQAIQAAGEVGLVHRDIKPENILVTRRGRVKVADFGLCRDEASEGMGVTQSGVTMGTPLYMSPEQAQGHATDHRSDLYSLGVTFYHMLSGNPPFRGDSAVSLALKHVREFPRSLLIHRPDLPIEVDRLVMKLMAKSPNDRYQSAAEMLSDLSKLRPVMQGESSGTTGAITDAGNALMLREDNVPALATLDPWTASPLATRIGRSGYDPPPAPVTDHGAKPLTVMVRETTPREPIVTPKFQAMVAFAIGAVCLGGGALAGWKARAPEVSSLPAPSAVTMPMLLAVPQWEAVPRQKSAEEQFRYAAFSSPRDEWVAAWLAIPGYFRGSHELVSRAYMQVARIWFRQDARELLERLKTELESWKDKQTRDIELVEVIHLGLLVRNEDYEGAAEGIKKMTQGEIGKIFDPILLQLTFEITADAISTMTNKGKTNQIQPFVFAQRLLFRQLFRIEGRNPNGAGRAG